MLSGLLLAPGRVDIGWKLHWQVSVETGDGSGHDLTFNYLVLRIEIHRHSHPSVGEPRPASTSGPQSREKAMIRRIVKRGGASHLWQYVGAQTNSPEYWTGTLDRSWRH